MTTKTATHSKPEQWHALSAEQALNVLQSSRQGLSQDEAQQRLERDGPNRIPEAKKRSALMRLLAQFHNVLIYVLLLAGAVTALLQHWLDASVILGVVVINAIIGFVQEGKAEDALAAIRQMLSPKTLVIRNGKRITIDAEQLVVGDILPLQTGDKVAADLRLIQCKGLSIEEAALTGESIPVEKTDSPVSADTVLADRRSMAFSGTLVTAGQGLGMVVATGANTEIGRISLMVAGVEELTTPLLRQMAQFGRWLTGGIIFLAALTFSFGVFLRDYTATEMFLAAVGLAVAAIPEGLPAIMTITLAIGVQRMASNNAIIRRLPAVETLGSLSVICSDKTGTLTKNEMTVRIITTATRTIKSTGEGYDPHGGYLFEKQDYAPLEDPLMKQALLTALLCNDASIEHHDSAWQIQGDPMEAALVVAAIKAGLTQEHEHANYPRTDLIPFDSSHKLMATLHHSHHGGSFICVKGAPEQLLARCAFQAGSEGEETLNHTYWNEQMEQMGNMGLRVLALAKKTTESHHAELTFDDVKNNLTLLGLFGLIDPPRPEAIEAVTLCQSAGIRVKMITGDHAVTARAIARQVGLTNTQSSLTGQEIDMLSEEELTAKIKRVDVFARVNPEHKLQLVKILQSQGHVVAMTGDGVNDAPALKRADVGVAMGKNGTEVAKEASEMVLTDDNFATIVRAVEEGRTVYDNIRKAILFILPTNGGEALVILGAILLGFSQFPLTPVQILWVNMITAVTLALALAFEPSEQDIMHRPPRDSKAPVLNRLFLWRIAFVSIILMLGTFGLFQWQLGQGDGIEKARTVAVNTLVMYEIFYLFNSRYLMASVLNREGILGNRHALLAVALLIVFQLGFTYLPPLQTLFGTAAIDLQTWLIITLVASSVLWLVEGEKLLLRQIEKRQR